MAILLAILAFVLVFHGVCALLQGWVARAPR